MDLIRTEPGGPGRGALLTKPPLRHRRASGRGWFEVPESFQSAGREQAQLVWAEGLG